MMSNGNGNGNIQIGTNTVKMGLAQMLKGGVIVSYFTNGIGVGKFNKINYPMTSTREQTQKRHLKSIAESHVP